MLEILEANELMPCSYFILKGLCYASQSAPCSCFLDLANCTETRVSVSFTFHVTFILHCCSLKKSLGAVIISAALALFHNTCPFPEFFFSPHRRLTEIVDKFPCMFLAFSKMLAVCRENTLRLMILLNRVLTSIFNTF